MNSVIIRFEEQRMTATCPAPNRVMLSKPEVIITTYELARKTGVVEKQLGGVLSAMTRKRLSDMSLIEIMGRDSTKGLRFRLNSKAITTALADKRVRMLISSYK